MRAFAKGILADLIDIIRDVDALELGATAKGAASNSGQAAVGGKSHGLQIVAVCKSQTTDLLHVLGDIDAGGFSILKDLRNKTGIPFKMYRMDIETLKYYEKYGKVLTESDRIRLKEIEKDEEFQEVVSYMLLHNVKLEQECVGIELRH